MFGDKVVNLDTSFTLKEVVALYMVVGRANGHILTNLYDKMHKSLVLAGMSDHELEDINAIAIAWLPVASLARMQDNLNSILIAHKEALVRKLEEEIKEKQRQLDALLGN